MKRKYEMVDIDVDFCEDEVEVLLASGENIFGGGIGSAGELEDNDTWG